MSKYIDSASKILSRYNHLHYTDIIKLSIEEGLLVSEGKTPIDTLNSIIGTDINTKGLGSIFLRIGTGIYALRNKEEGENLLIYLKYRLKDTEIWIIDDKDERYCDVIFGKNIFEDNKKSLLFLLEELQKKGKIESYTNILPDGGILVKITENQEELLGKKIKAQLEDSKESLENITGGKLFTIELSEKIGIFEKEAQKFKKISRKLTENSGLNELASTSNKITEIFLSLLPLISFNSKITPDAPALKQIEEANKTIQASLNNTVFKQLAPVIDTATTILDSYDLNALTKERLSELNELKAQLGFIKSMLDPKDFFHNLSKFNPELLSDSAEVIGGFALPTVLPISSKTEPTHIFEGYEGNQSDLHRIIRGTAQIKNLEKISKPKYYDDAKKTGQQRDLDEKRAEKIKDYIKNSNTKFFPEVIIGLHLRDNKAITITSLVEKNVKIDTSGSIKKLSIEQININVDLLEDDQITRIDGNHRLSLSSKLDDRDNIFVSYCFIVFEERKALVEDIGEAKKQNEERESRLFYILNNTAVKVTSEHALKVIFNIDKDEMTNFYGNDEVLRRCYIGIEKYRKLKDATQTMALQYGKDPYSKIETIMKYIEKYEEINGKKFSDKEISDVIDIIQQSIQNIGTEYGEIRDRDDYLFLVLNIYFDNSTEEPAKLNQIIKSFCAWVKGKGFTKIISTEEPVLWEIYKKELLVIDALDIHGYAIKPTDHTKFSNGLRLLKESKGKIVSNQLSEKQIGLEKIVDAFVNISTIIADRRIYNPAVGGSISGTRGNILVSAVDRIDKSKQPKAISYIEERFDVHLWQKIANNDFYVRHTENISGGGGTLRENIEDAEFIEYLYREYDSAIKFILDKHGFTI